MNAGAGSGCGGFCSHGGAGGDVGDGIDGDDCFGGAGDGCGAFCSHGGAGGDAGDGIDGGDGFGGGGSVRNSKGHHGLFPTRTPRFIINPQCR